MISSSGRKKLIQSAMIAAALVVCAGSSQAQNAQQDYATMCAACHGDTGKGDGPAGKALTPPPMDFATSLKGKSDDWITKAISQGGAAIGESPVMPGFTQLSPAQVKALVDYIKKLGS